MISKEKAERIARKIIQSKLDDPDSMDTFELYPKNDADLAEVHRAEMPYWRRLEEVRIQKWCKI